MKTELTLTLTLTIEEAASVRRALIQHRSRVRQMGKEPPKNPADAQRLLIEKEAADQALAKFSDVLLTALSTEGEK